MFGLRRQVADGIEKVVYPNGVALTLRQDDRVPIAAVRCYVRGGSVSEELPGGRGVAHLLEHLIATASAAAMEQHADGALLNAFTTHDYTCFHWSALEEDVASSLRRFFTGLQRVAALECDLEAERNVVLQEIDLFREKRLALFQQCFLEEMFDVHPLRYPVCGYAHLLRELRASEVEPYLARCYTGANLRLVVTGAFDEDEVIATVAEVSAPLPAGRRFELKIEEPARMQEHVFTCETGGVRGAHTQIGLRSCGGDPEEAVAFAALARTINDSPGSALRRRLADAGVSGDVTARSLASAFGVGYFSIIAQHSDDDGPRVEETLRRWLADVASDRVEIALTAVRTAARRDDEPTLEGWASLLGHGEVRSERALESCVFLERLRVIEEDDVRRAVSHHLEPGNLTIGTLRTPRVRIDARPRTERSAAAPLERTLANGVRLLVLPTPSAIASCQVLWRGGLLAETAETNGLCSLMARLLPRSVPAELAPELEHYRAATEAELFAFCDESFFGVSLTVAGRDLEDGLGLLSAMATRPFFSSDAVHEERKRTADWISSSGTAWLPDIQSQLKRTLYLRHPYRLNEIGQPESLLRLEAEDLADCHRRTCVGGNTVVVVSGRVDTEHGIDRLASLFDVVPAGSFAGALVEDETDAPRTTIITRPWSHAALAVGYRGIPWSDETWCALEIVKALLVGPENDSVRGRLMRAMREAGAAYGVHCANQAGFGDGHFAIAAAYAADQEETVVAIVAREIERLHAGDLTEAELDHCRKLYLLHHLREYEWPRGHAYAVGRQVLFSSHPACWRTVAEQVRRIRVEDVASAVSRAFTGRRMGLVLARPQGGRP